MIARCESQSDISFRYYGARGIRVCHRWRASLDAFIVDMGVPPIGFSIDRVDNDGNYEPSNCRWATIKQQQRNKRRTRMLTFRGETMSIGDMAEKYGLSAAVLEARLRKAWPLREALLVPVLTLAEKKGRRSDALRMAFRERGQLSLTRSAS